MNNTLFGNIRIILGGDFVHILLVVHCGNREATLATCLQSSTLWSSCTIVSLHANQRVHTGEANYEFASRLRHMTYQSCYQGTIPLPSFIPLCTTIDQVCAHALPSTLLSTAHQHPSTFKLCGILAIQNDTVPAINPNVPQEITGTVCQYYSIDQAESIGNTHYQYQLPVLYHHSLNLASLPQSKVELKVYDLVILLRNLYPNEGLCNGTRMRVTRMH